MIHPTDSSRVESLSKTQMLDAINMKIARTGGGTGPGETRYFEPVDERDIIYFIVIGRSAYAIMNITDKFKTLWKSPLKYLDKQSDDCIQYVYSLI